MRFTPDGGTVEVRARRSPRGVDDRGPRRGARASPTPNAARVFERFYRADAARSSRDGGAGLGLAIARWIVDLHGGEIHPERRDPAGAAWWSRCPRTRATQQPNEPTESQRV